MKVPKDKGFSHMSEVRGAFRDLDSSLTDKLGRKLELEVPRGLRRGLFLGVPTLLATVGLMCSSYGNKIMYDSDPQGEKRIPFVGAYKKEFDIADYPLDNREGVYQILAPYIDEAEVKLPEAEKQESWDLKMILRQAEMDGLNPKTVTSLMRSCYINREKAERGYENENDRFPPSFAPTSYKPNWFYKDEEKTSWRVNALGVVYLGDCIAHGRDIADVYAYYFASDPEVRNAIVESGSTRYFPAFGENGEILEPGYGSKLPQFKRDLINTAVALRHITSEDGKDVNFSRLEQIRRKVREGRK